MSNPTHPATPGHAAPTPAPVASPPAFNGRSRFLAACACQEVDRPPVWLMRQAGRALPEYRALKEHHTFVQLVQAPDLAAEVTLQPIRRFHFDAAVIFSDILIAAEGLGQGYRFREEGGIAMDFPLRTPADVDRLETGAVAERLAYIGKAIRQVRAELGLDTAILGFAGSPWTLACFMVEGGSGGDGHAAKRLLYAEPAWYERLAAKITQAVITLLHTQVDAGADAVQIFDSLAEHLAFDVYERASGRWIRQIADALSPRVPVILYLRGSPAALDLARHPGLGALSVDWRNDLAALRRSVPARLALQGNLDPALMLTSPDVVREQTRRLLDSLRGARGHIMNLGHGLPPGAKLENIEALVHTVQGYR